MSQLAATQVRGAVKALLINATAAGDRVHTGRSWPLAEDQLPALKLAVTGEDVTSDSMHLPRLQEHQLRLEVRGFVRDVDDLDAALDDLVGEVLAVLFADDAAASLEPLPNVVMELQGSDRTAQDDANAASTGGVAIRLAITYQTLSNDPFTLV